MYIYCIYVYFGVYIYIYILDIIHYNIILNKSMSKPAERHPGAAAAWGCHCLWRGPRCYSSRRGALSRVPDYANIVEVQEADVVLYVVRNHTRFVQYGLHKHLCHQKIRPLVLVLVPLPVADNDHRPILNVPPHVLDHARFLLYSYICLKWKYEEMHFQHKQTSNSPILFRPGLFYF